METNGRLQIETPEGIRFSYEPASPILRMFAWMIDALMIAAVMQSVHSFARHLNLIAENIGTAFYFIAFFILSWGYYITLEWFYEGRTAGKKLFQLRVMDAAGFRLRPDQIVLRNLMRVIDFIPVLYLTGGLAAFFHPRHQRLGDMLAGTVVIRESADPRPDISNLLADRYNSFLDQPHLVYRARSWIEPADASLLLDALLRRDELDPDARLDIYRRLARHFKSHVHFPDEHLSDERYLRNYADILFNRGRAPAALTATQAPDGT